MKTLSNDQTALLLTISAYVLSYMIGLIIGSSTKRYIDNNLKQSTNNSPNQQEV